MSSKSLKFKIKKKWEVINNEKAKILALLEEIRFDAESRIKEVEKTVTTALGQTNKTKFTDCLGDLERVHQQLCIISEKLEDKESGESQEESDVEENDTVNGSLKVITEEDKSEVPSDVTDDTEKKSATAALQDIQEKCTPEDDCSGVDEAQNAEKAAQLLTESNLTDDADFTERCNSPAPTGVTSLHSSTTDTSFASASQSFHSSTKSSKLNWGEPSWKPVAKQVMGPVALQVPQAQYSFVEQNSIPYPAVSTTYSGYSVPQYNTAQLNKQQPGVQTNLVTSQFQLSNAQYLPQYANHAVGPTPSAFQPTNNFGTYPNCPPPASYTSFRPQPNHSDAINPIATNKDATLTKADDGGFKVPLPVNSQQDGPRKTDQYRPVEVNSIYGSVRATSSSSRLTESSAVTAPTSLPSQKQKRMLRGKKKPSSVSSQPEMSIPSDYGFGPRLSSLRLKDGSVMNVSVIDIASPTFFWVRLESKTIEDFAERMSYYYTQTPVECLKIPQPIKVGMLVCSTYNDDGEFYRARVIGMKQADGGVPELFKVLYIDYGNQSWVYRKDIMAIPEGFCEVPPYAVPCTLSQVGPLKGGFDWSEEARQTMYELLKDKDSTKVKVNVVADCPLAFVDLFVRSEPSDSQMNLADELKRLKLARSVQNVHVANYFRNNAREDNNTESCLQLTTVIAMHSGVVKSIKPSDIELRNNESVSLFPPKATEPVNERVFNWINEQQQITLQPQEDSEKSSSKDRNTQPRVLTDVAKRMVDHAMNSTGRANQKTGAKPNHSKLSDLDASSKSNDFTEVERYEGESLLRNSSTASESEKVSAFDVLSHPSSASFLSAASTGANAYTDQELTFEVWNKEKEDENTSEESCEPGNSAAERDIVNSGFKDSENLKVNSEISLKKKLTSEQLTVRQDDRSSRHNTDTKITNESSTINSVYQYNHSNAQVAEHPTARVANVGTSCYGYPTDLAHMSNRSPYYTVTHQYHPVVGIPSMRVAFAVPRWGWWDKARGERNGSSTAIFQCQHPRESVSWTVTGGMVCESCNPVATRSITEPN